VNKTTRGFLILVGLIVGVGVFCLWLPFAALPGAGIGVALPVIYVPGEVLVRDFFGPGVHLTNTLAGMFGADLIVLLILGALALRGGVKAVPGRLQAILEMLVEYMYNLAKSVAGSRAGRIFPLIMGIFLFLLVANWLELIPGVDSVGLLHCATPGLNGYPINEEQVLGFNTLKVESPLDSGTRATIETYCACELTNFEHIPEYSVEACAAAGYVNPEHSAAEGAAAEGGGAGEGESAAATEGEGETAHAVDTAGVNPNLFVVTSFVRAAATDLNLTVALALLAVVAVQVYGVWELGPDYFQKFINLRALGNVAKKPGGLMDFIVGFLEIISEFSRILSFAFRLFGNIFGGQVLLFVMAFLVATMLPVIFYAFELFVGLIQAFVFAMLTLAFSAGAMAGHGDEQHDH